MPTPVAETGYTLVPLDLLRDLLRRDAVYSSFPTEATDTATLRERAFTRAIVQLAGPLEEPVRPGGCSADIESVVKIIGLLGISAADVVNETNDQRRTPRYRELHSALTSLAMLRPFAAMFDIDAAIGHLNAVEGAIA
jgi:hypothetical protein